MQMNIKYHTVGTVQQFKIEKIIDMCKIDTVTHIYTADHFLSP